MVVWLVSSLTGFSAAQAATNDFVLKHEGWSFERSLLHWQGDATAEGMKAAGKLDRVAGWVEYDVEIPAGGWYALWLRGMPGGWTRTVSLDDKTVFWHSVSTPEDEDKDFGGFKEANLWLEKGRHTLRFHRVTWPGDLPDYWELRTAAGDPADSIRVVAGETVVRAGEPVSLTFLGGTTQPTRYELVFRDAQTGEMLPAGAVDFPASSKPVERRVDVKPPREGVFHLQAKVGGGLLRPADLKAGTFVVVDAKAVPPVAGELKTRTVVDIDCAAEPPADGFWEKDGKTRVVSKASGRYRESSGLGTDGDGYWGLDGFSYKVRLPEVDRLYRLRVVYPDDERRSMGFWTNDGSEPKGTAAANVNTGGVETGDQYPITNTLQTHEAFFYPQGRDDVIIAVLNLVPGMKAAATRITIDLVESGLPPAPLGVTRGRSMGFYFEENGRWRKFFGAGKGGIEEDLKTLNRWGQWNRHLGANLMFPTVNVYQGNHYPSRILDGYFSRSINEVRLGALMAEKYDGQYVAEFHLTGQVWFDRRVMGVWTDEETEDGRRRIEVKFASPEVEETVLRDRDGNYKHSWEPFMYNALHPKVQEKYISILGELADTLGDTESFAGISSRMMFTWQWQGWNALPNLSWGYDDWTILYFETDTGIKVPGTAGGATRFRERYNYLTGPQRERWIEWRCAKIFEYHRRMLARIQQAKPSARLFFNWFGLDPRHALSSDLLEQMREVGMDWARYAKEESIVIIPPTGGYGRRYSLPTTDASKVDALYDPSAQTAGRFGGRAYGIYSDYYEVNRNLDWAKLGGKPHSAFDSNLPSGLNERGMYAQALADCDTGFLSNGGSGWIFGTPKVMQPFFREYRSLPAVPFEPWDQARDPVAVWSHQDKNGQFWFYAVNRLPVPVKVRIGVKATAVVPAPGGEALSLKGGALELTLEPFMLKAFLAPKGGALTTFKAEVPPSHIQQLEPMLAFARDLRADLAARRVAPELPEVDVQAALASFDGAQTAWDRGEYWKARGLLERQAAVQVYYLSGRYPPGLWQRSQPHGLPVSAEKPVNPVVVVAEAAEEAAQVDDLDYDSSGRLWVSGGGRVHQWSADGSQTRVLPLFAPYETLIGDIRKQTLLPSRPLSVTALRTTPEGALLVQPGAGAPLRYDDQKGRLLPLANKVFSIPGLPVRLLAVTQSGDALISCGAAGREGVDSYDAAGSLQRRIWGAQAHGAAVDSAGRIALSITSSILVLSSQGQELARIPGEGFTRLVFDPAGGLLVALHEKSRTLHAFSPGTSDRWSLVWKQSMPKPVAAMAFAPGGQLTVGFTAEDNGAVVRNYSVASEGLRAGKDVVGGIEGKETRSLSDDTSLKVRDGFLYYGSHGKLMRLTPGTPDAVEVAYDPQFQAGHPAFESFAFAANGDLYLSSNWNGKTRGINVYLCRKAAGGWGRPEAMNDGAPLWEGGYNVADDLETDERSGLILRLKNPETKGNNLSLYRWSPTGPASLLLDLGDAPQGSYGLARTSDGGLLVTGGTARKIVRLAADGAVLWQRERIKSSPPGYDDLRNPLGITAESAGGVWVTDPMRHHILRLDATGRLLGAFGKFGSGLGEAVEFNRPTGIAAIKDARGVEWIYVADSGNRRILKWRLP